MKDELVKQEKDPITPSHETGAEAATTGVSGYRMCIRCGTPVKSKRATICWNCKSPDLVSEADYVRPAPEVASPTDGEGKIELLVLSIAVNQFTTPTLPSGKDIITAVNERAALVEALKGVAVMLNTDLGRYESEPWAQRVRAALTGS